MVEYDYRISKVLEDEIEKMHYRIINIINQVLQNKNLEIANIEITLPSERDEILNKFNTNSIPYTKDKDLIQLFKEQVKKTPNNIALFFEDKKISYKELDDLSSSLAAYLLKYNIKHEDKIAIFLDKSIEMIVSILAILKVNAAFLPIDIEYPTDRIDYIMQDSKIKLAITNRKLSSKITNLCETINIDTINLSQMQDFYYKAKDVSSLAYIMYTSGSTGKPKGVMIEQKSILRLALKPNFISFSGDERILQTGSIVFDACTFEIWAALLNGLKLYILKKEDLLNPIFLGNYLEKNKITTLFLTSQLFNQLVDVNPTMFHNVRDLITGGEVLSIKHLNRIMDVNPNLQVIHAYGPTENTTFTTCFKIDKKYSSNVPIGYPLSGTTCYVVSKTGSLQPIGVPGELWTGGDGVSRGYLNKAELTNDKFISNPFDKTSKIYKTGDLVKWNKNGTIDFIGRIDNQVKIHGFRIELSEINNTILKFPNIKDSTTIVKTINGSKQICTYLVPNGNIDITGLKTFLQTYLPTYMIPKYFCLMEKFPMNINGKIDIYKLPLPILQNSKKEIIEPKSENELRFAKIWKEIFNINKVGTNFDFFEVGGDSLLSIKLLGKVQEEFNVNINIKDIFEKPKFNELLNLIERKIFQKDPVPIEKIRKRPTSNKKDYPLCSAQKRIYYSSEIAGNSGILYNIPGGLEFSKHPNYKKLEDAFIALIKRHEAFRTYFELETDSVVQKIADNVDFKLNVVTAKYEDKEEIFKSFIKPFDLKVAPLLRAELVYFENGKSMLLFDTHHIIFDGASLEIFIQELGNLYFGMPLPELSLTYKDFAIWENNHLDQMEASKKYWLNEFKDDIPVLNLPTKKTRPAVKSYKGSKIYKTINTTLTKKIYKLAKEYNSTPYMILLSSYYILLSKYSNQEEIVVGSPSVGRELEKFNSIIGMFVNTLPLKTTINTALSFKKFLMQVRAMCLNAFEHQFYPFDKIVENLELPRDPSRNPLFDVLFTYQSQSLSGPCLGDIKSKYYIPDSDISKFDLSLECIPNGNTLKLNFEYSSDLFTRKFIDELSNAYLSILNDITNDIDIKLSDISIVSMDEQYKILVDFNKTKMPYPKNKSLVDLFKIQVKKHPNNIAVVFKDKSITYKELDEKSNTLAEKISKYKLPNNEIVGVYMDKSIELVISIWAILKCGLTYMPMYTGYPKSRLDYMVENSCCHLIISKKQFLNRSSFKCSILNFNNYKRLKNTTNFELNKIFPTNLAYVIYTSGSTGNPKGVKITHRCLNNFIHSFNELFKGITKNDKLLSSTNISFDVSIWELFLSLLNGATLVLYEEEIIKNIVKYCDSIVNNEITTLYIPPNILQEVYKLLRKRNSRVNKLLVGVEPIKRTTLNKFYKINPNLKIINGYGPTETTICSTALQYLPAPSSDRYVSIGKPLGNTKIYILDKNLALVPIGVKGELYISGDGVGQGYINNLEENNTRFVKNVFEKKSIMYKTGDLAVWNNDGTIKFIGREDSQIKLSGYRIELKEIDNCINSYPGITKALTIVQKHNDQRYLVSYYTASSSVNNQELTAYLQNKLAFYMVPKTLIGLQKFPLTPNGKVDFKALPKPNIRSYIKYEAPSNPLEKALCKIWQNLFNIEKIGVNDNFFELGGDSLSAIRLQIEGLKKNLKFTYADIFKYPTIKLLAKKATTSTVETVQKQNYDFTKINQLLSFNKIKNIPNKIKLKPIGNVLLAGSTGFLGVHILDEILSKEENSIIYCIVRKKGPISGAERLKNTLQFYFGEKYLNTFDNRIRVVEADITKENFGLPTEELEVLVKNTSIFINSAALVKHYGEYSLFNSINVVGTKNIIDFCEKYKKKLYHISTTSVSGQGLPENNEEKAPKVTHFSEKDLYRNQNLNNAYIKTKFEAEKLILEEIANKKLKATIFRMGNISNRYLDAKFQINAQENAFINRIKSVLSLGVLQKGFIKHRNRICASRFM